MLRAPADGATQTRSSNQIANTTDADTRQGVETTAPGLLINPSFGDLQTLCEFSKRQNLCWVNRRWTSYGEGAECILSTAGTHRDTALEAVGSGIMKLMAAVPDLP
jgi:hypothetical protein